MPGSWNSLEPELSRWILQDASAMTSGWLQQEIWALWPQLHSPRASKDDKTDSGWTVGICHAAWMTRVRWSTCGPGFFTARFDHRRAWAKELDLFWFPQAPIGETEQKKDLRWSNWCPQRSKADPIQKGAGMCWFFQMGKVDHACFPCPNGNTTSVIQRTYDQYFDAVLPMVVPILIFPCVLHGFLDALRQIFGRSTCRSWSLAICSRVTTMMTRPARRKWAECTWCIMGSHTLPGILKGLGDGRWI